MPLFPRASLPLLLPVLLALQACAHPSAPKVAVPTATTPAAAPPLPTGAETCSRITRALDHYDEERKAATDLLRFQEIALEERRAVIAARGLAAWERPIADYERASVAYVEWLRSAGDVTIFTEKMGAFLSHCTVPECVPVAMVIGAHTMHQPRLDETLPRLADALANVALRDPTLQAELVALADEARRTGAALGPQLGQGAQGALDKARARLRASCGGASEAPPRAAE